MKIAHITIFPCYSQSVFKKVEDKARAAIAEGLNMDFYLLNPDIEKKDLNCNIVKVDTRFTSIDFFKKIWFRLFKFSYLEEAVSLRDYDAIILRYPLIDGFGSYRFVRKYGQKIFTEHHADEVAELFSVGRMVDTLRAYNEKIFSRYFLSKVAGIIGVTSEICRLELEKITPQVKPCFTIANGIAVDSTKRTKFVPFDGEKIIAVFVAAEFAAWHGLEGLLCALEKYDGNTQIELWLIGNINTVQKRLVEKIEKDCLSIKIFGKKYDYELDELMDKATFAISSLALSKENMKEACTLKSREYIARGLPFVYAYKDTDLDGSEIFARRFEEGALRAEDLIEFAKEITFKKDEVEQAMKEFAKKIDWRCKLKQMYEAVSKNG